MAAAEKMLTDSLAWRKEFKTDSILTEEFDESIFGSVGYVYKTDKEGRPVCYNFYGDLDQNKVFGDVEKYANLQFLRCCDRLTPFTSFLGSSAGESS